LSKLLAEGTALEEEAIRTSKESCTLMTSLNERCNEAVRHTESCMNKRIKKISSLKAALEKQLVEMVGIIKAAENSVAHTNKVFDWQNLPPSKAASPTGAGNKEECEGGTALMKAAEDTDIDVYNEPMDPSMVALSERTQATLDALQKLKESEAQLREDFKNKDLALRIDETCRKVTPKSIFSYIAPEVGRVEEGVKQ
jgi:hypothetical protein